MSFFLKGVHVPHRKNTADSAPIKMTVPKTVMIPMSMHIGKPSVPIVSVGDHVHVGTLIGEQNGAVSSPIYSSVSGTVKKIDDILLANGMYSKAIVIVSDGLQAKDPSISPPVIACKEDLVSAIQKSGIVGLGGAGFPTYIKFNVKDVSAIDELIINGAECEPYITSDTRTMIDETDDIAFAISLIKKHLGIKKVIIGIEANKKSAIIKMKEIAEDIDGAEVKVLPSVYPQGGEKVLIYHTTGKVVPAGKLPIDVGCIVCNCTTMAAIAKFAKTGMPLVEKCVTVDGSAVKEPQNVIVPIGTSMADVFEFCKGFISEPKKILYGGPMMGISVASIDMPVLKNTNALLAFNEKDALRPKMTQCIHCGMCVSHCPFGLSPIGIAKAYKNGNIEELKKLRVDICMECGCCSYICPAKRPLAETNKLAKNILREYVAKQKEIQK